MNGQIDKGYGDKEEGNHAKPAGIALAEGFCPLPGMGIGTPHRRLAKGEQIKVNASGKEDHLKKKANIVHSHAFGQRLNAPGSSKLPVCWFFRTLFQLKKRPFMTTYTPGGSVCTKARALPRLKKPSEEVPKA